MRGVLEGIFAQGQVYVLISRVPASRRAKRASGVLLLVRSVRICIACRQQDPRNFELLGLPPLDMLEEVAEAWRQANLDASYKLKAMLDIDRYKYGRYVKDVSSF